jgi:predicted transglutaminase-like cysteine proteinase
MWRLCGERGRARLKAISGPCSVAAFVLALAIGVGPVQAQKRAAVSMPLATALESRGRARPISAWADFCNRVPTECEVGPDEPRMITLTEEVWRLLVTVNNRVNATIKPMTDAQHWSVPDRWDLAEDGYGDCEDYQLLKRKLLAEQGLPRRALRMTVVIDDLDQGHAILTIRTDRGDFILDNRTDSVLPWNATGYTFVKQEGDGTGAWVSLDGASPITTAAR